MAFAAVRYEVRTPLALWWRTEGDGSFRIPLLHPTRYTITTTDERAAPWTSARLRGPRDHVVVGPPELPVVLRVRIVDGLSGKPIAGVEADVFHDLPPATPPELAMHPPRFSARSDERGELAVPRRPEKPDFLRLSAEGYGRVTRKLAYGQLMVELLPECVVEGRVLSAATGAPVAGARVWAASRPADAQGNISYGNVPAAAITTGADGAFELNGLPAGPCAIQAYHADWVVPDTMYVEARGRLRQDIRLRARLRLRGTLENLPPDEGWRIQLITHHRSVRHGDGWGCRFSRDRNPPPFSVTEDGLFEVEVFDPGKQQIFLTRSSRTATSYPLFFPVATLDVSADREWTGDTAGLTSGWVRGRASLGPAVADVARLAVRAAPPLSGERRTPLGRPHYACPVSPAGDFALELPPDRYTLQVVDVATGLVIHVDEAKVRVRPSVTVSRDLAVRARVARIRLERRSSSPVVSRLALSWETGSGTCLLEAGQTEVVLLLPQAATRIVAHTERTSRAVGEVIAERNDGERVDVTLRVDPR